MHTNPNIISQAITHTKSACTIQVMYMYSTVDFNTANYTITHKHTLTFTQHLHTKITHAYMSQHCIHKQTNTHTQCTSMHSNIIVHFLYMYSPSTHTHIHTHIRMHTHTKHWQWRYGYLLTAVMATSIPCKFTRARTAAQRRSLVKEWWRISHGSWRERTTTCSLIIFSPVRSCSKIWLKMVSLPVGLPERTAKASQMNWREWSWRIGNGGQTYHLCVCVKEQ